MNKKNLLGILMVVIIILAGIIILIGGTKIGQKNNPNLGVVVTPMPTKIAIETVTLTANGFSPSDLKINSQSRVIWINNSGTQASVNSDPYPYNTKWVFLNLGTFANGSSVSTVFAKPGIFTYHNQLNPNQKGMVTVK